jgi:outer membrane usher protein FimD/PapC
LQGDLSASHRFDDQWSINAGSTYRTFGYRELEDAVFSLSSDNGKSRYRDRQSVALAWSHPTLAPSAAA